MDQATLNYLKTHATSIAQKAIEGDLLSRRILNLYNQYRAWKANDQTATLLSKSITQYQARIEKEMGNRHA